MGARRLQVGLAAALLSVSAALPADDGNKEMTMGEAVFVEHCAACHGPAGDGTGPVAGLLRKPPPDLRWLSLANNGRFPDKRVRQTIDGRGMPGAHGTAEMPVWGKRWLETGKGGSTTARANLIAVIGYLKRIQLSEDD